MDEFLVTNQQFVDFLNHNLSRISLEKEAVKGDGANWFLLGEVSADYEPIVFQNGKFHVNDPAYASNPALRVTGYGATAFAKFYDRRLPTEAELLFVMIKGESQVNKEEVLEKAHREWHHRNPGVENEPEANTEESKTHSSKDPLPRDRSVESHTAKRVFSAVLLIPNALGIRGLNDETLGEWVLKGTTASSEEQTQINHYAVIGGPEVTLSKNGSPSSRSVARSPSEESEFVSFRTIKATATVSQ